MQKLVFFGSSAYCLVTLNGLRDAGYEIVAVVTQPPKPVGRKQMITPTAVELWAMAHGVEVIKPESWRGTRAADELQRLKDLACEVAILSVYGKILPQSVIEIFPKGIVNIHPSLLPAHRGPAPAVGAILSGEKTSGTSVMLLSAEMDAGPVLGQIEFDVTELEVPDTYYKKGFALGTVKLLEVLPKYLSGELQPQEQDHTKATYTKMLTREDGEIDWSESAELIERKVRAYTPWPGTWTIVRQGEENVIYLSSLMADKIGLEAQTSAEEVNLSPRRMKVLNAKLIDDLLKLEKVQLEGELAKNFDELRLAII
ncbi:MAG: methionyl-tRNA formyltransferase [Patescibacteria group bacterium]|nr:MAG: methionyl-tRNA formyltransferase [Patescibacteria group bacterium]